MRRLRPPAWVTVTPIGCESALTLGDAHYHGMSRERSHARSVTFRGRRGWPDGSGRGHGRGRCGNLGVGDAMPNYRSWTHEPRWTAAHDNDRGARTLRGRHRHRGPLPAPDRVEDVLRLLDRVRRRATEHPRLPGLPRSPGRTADDQQAGRRARPGDRRGDRGDARRRRPAGTARTTSTRTCRRATRSASTTCRSPRSGG